MNMNGFISLKYCSVPNIFCSSILLQEYRDIQYNTIQSSFTHFVSQFCPGRTPKEAYRTVKSLSCGVDGTSKSEVAILCCARTGRPADLHCIQHSMRETGASPEQIADADPRRPCGLALDLTLGHTCQPFHHLLRNALSRASACLCTNWAGTPRPALQAAPVYEL